MFNNFTENVENQTAQEETQNLASGGSDQQMLTDDDNIDNLKPFSH